LDPLNMVFIMPWVGLVVWVKPGITLALKRLTYYVSSATQVSVLCVLVAVRCRRSRRSSTLG